MPPEVQSAQQPACMGFTLLIRRASVCREVLCTLSAKSSCSRVQTLLGSGAAVGAHDNRGTWIHAGSINQHCVSSPSCHQLRTSWGV
jgi:hypothetical protein